MFSFQLVHANTPAAEVANRVEILRNIMMDLLTPDMPNTLIGNMARTCKQLHDFFYKNPALEPAYVLPPLRYLGAGSNVRSTEREIMKDRVKYIWEDICHAFQKEGGQRGQAHKTENIRYEYVFRDAKINQCEKYWRNPEAKDRIGVIVPSTFSSNLKTRLEIFGTVLETVGEMSGPKTCDRNIYRVRYDAKPTRTIAYAPCYDTGDYVAVWDDVSGPPRRIKRRELVKFVMSHARAVMCCKGAFV